MSTRRGTRATSAAPSSVATSVAAGDIPGTPAVRRSTRNRTPSAVASNRLPNLATKANSSYGVNENLQAKALQGPESLQSQGQIMRGILGGVEEETEEGKSPNAFPSDLSLLKGWL